MEHRISEALVTVVGPDGAPLVGTEVVVEQTAHEFLFGCIGFDLIPLANGEVGRQDGADPPDAQGEDFAAKWLELFNFATLPFYWGDFEPVRGRPDTERLLAAARWFVDRGSWSRGTRSRGTP